MTTTADRTTERYSPLCPDWCTLNDYQHEGATFIERPGGRPIVDHQGPSFGPFFVDATEYLTGDVPLVTRVHADMQDAPDGAMGAAALRELAAQATAAADFLEACQQRAYDDRA